MRKIILLFLLVIILALGCTTVFASTYTLDNDGYILNEYNYRIIHETTIKNWALSSNHALVDMSRSWQNIIVDIEEHQQLLWLKQPIINIDGDVVGYRSIIDNTIHMINNTYTIY